MNLSNLYKNFTKDNIPEWMCPTCEKSLLRLEEGSFKSSESGQSKRGHKHEGWGFDWVVYRFNCVLTCTNSQCLETVMCVGSGLVDEFYDIDDYGYSTQEYCDYFKPKFFYPALSLFNIHNDVPKSVRDSLVDSFSMFFCNPPASMNHVRVALESLMTELKVKRYKTVNGSRKLIFLHQRIELLPSKYEDLKERLLAAKWLGNAGSHDGSNISTEDVVNAYAIVEDVLNEIYDNKKSHIKKMAKKINKKKGP